MPSPPQPAMRIAPQPAIERDILAASRLHGAGRGAEAESLLRSVLDQAPEHPMALTWLAEIALGRKDHAGALELAQSVLHREPNFAPSLAVLAQAKWLAGYPRDGLLDARRAVAIQPPNPHFRTVLAQLCIWLGEHAEAQAAIDELMAMADNDPLALARVYGLRGELLIAQSRFTEAAAVLEAALRLRPDHAPTQLLHSLNLLRLGRFAAGWRAYACNRAVPSFHPGGVPDLPGRLWDGESLAGKTILLRDDQGFGDAVQFFRYVWRLQAMQPKRIVLVCFPPLQTLFAAAAPFVDVRDSMAGIGPVDFHCLTTDLPYAFRTEFASIPANVAYLRALSAEPRLPAGQALKVGLVWSGDPRHLRDHQRSIPAEQFLTLAREPGARYFAVQKVIRDADGPALDDCPGVSRIGEHMRDFADTAAVLAQLDLLITVDTGIAHLAGALGVPIWLLVARTPDWRWFTEREDSPWYPTLRLFRQGDGGWPEVLARVQAALGQRIARARKG